MHPIGWRSIQIRYYDDKDPLILDAVRPLLRQLRDVVDKPYFVRHWRQGPHLRINLRATHGNWTRHVRPAVEQVIGEFLREHPSTVVLDEAADLRRQRTLAAMEQERGPLQPWYPDNSVQYEPYDDRRHILRTQDLGDLLDDFYADTTEAAFSMLDRVRSGRATRLGLALDLMMAVAYTSLPPIWRGAMSYRSHAEAFLANCDDPAGVRRRFDEHYQRYRDALPDRLTEVVNAVDGTGHVAFVSEWVALLRQYKARAEPLFASGRTTLPFGDAPSGWNRRSEMQALLIGNDAATAEMAESTWFQGHRLVINQLYAHFNRLGVSSVDRFLLCHLAANAVEEVTGVSAVDQIRRYVAHHPNPDGRPVHAPQTA